MVPLPAPVESGPNNMYMWLRVPRGSLAVLALMGDWIVYMRCGWE